jgi:hypothetical protein
LEHIVKEKPESNPSAAVEQPGSPAQSSTDLQDEYAGMGGSYTLDPATGKRTLRERTGWDPKAPVPAEAKE